MTRRKGIILAGGTGSRLFPLTHAVSKQLLPVYDKPMIFYPLSLQIAAGIEEVAIITTPAQRENFEACLGSGRDFGIEIRYIVQPSPDGLAQAYLLADGFLAGAPSMLTLGDNLFCGDEIVTQITTATASTRSSIFCYPVLDPQNYGVVTFDRAGRTTSIDEKPAHPRSDCAVTGLYLLDGDAPKRARAVRPSPRGELEITDLLQSYLNDGSLDVVKLGRGRWFDTGSPENLIDAANYVRDQLHHHGTIIGSPEIAAFDRALITPEQLLRRAASLHNTDYGTTLRHVAGMWPHVEDQPLLSIA